jgi:hypothetical protein
MAHTDRSSLRRFVKPAIPLAVIVCCAVCAAGTLTVDGVGYTKETAIANALRNAVERSVGLYVGGQTLVENHMLVSDKILTRTDGYVRSYELAATARELGLVRVTIRADVAEGKLRDELIAQQLLYEVKNRPRIMVLLDERVAGEEMFEKTATHVLEEQLLERGFKIIEPEQFKQVKEIERAKGLADADLASLGFRTGADLIVRGRISVGRSTPKMVYGVQFYTVPVQLNARIVRADNAQILVTKTERTKKNSREEFSAAQFGLEVGARTLGAELIEALNEFWRSEAYNRNEVELTVTGLNSGALARLENTLRSMGFVRDVALRYLEGTAAHYDLKVTGTVQDLRFALDGDTELGLSVRSVTANRLTVGAGTPSKPVSFVRQAPSMEIAAFTIQDIFPSRARVYEREPLGLVKIRSNDHPLSDLHVRVHIPAIMNLPVEQKVERLAGGAVTELALKLLPAQDKLLAATETRTVNGKVEVAYAGPTGTVTRTLTAPAKILDRNAMDWTEPEALGGFVTYKAPSIQALARKAVRAVPRTDALDGDLVNAAALFEALECLEIRYVKDPTPSGTMVLDRVQYPAETLELRSGDCDDLSVLYAALLSAIGIPAAVISYHDHVLVMFDTGVYAKNRLALSADTTMSVLHEGRVWIPIETTLVGKGFIEAWHVAAEEFHTALSEGQSVSIVDLHTAWRRYPPVAFDKEVSAVRLEGLAGRVAKQLDAIRQSANESIAAEARKLERGAGRSDDAALLNRLGILAVRGNDYAAALDYFGRAKRKSDAAVVAGNYASALLLSGKEADARKLFDATYTEDPTGRVAVNRALCYYVDARDEAGMRRFIEALREGVDMMPSSATLSEYLGIDLGDEDGTRAADEHEKLEAQSVNARRLKELVRQQVLSRYRQRRKKTAEAGGGDLSGTTSETSTGQSADRKPPVVMPFGGIRGADPEQVEKVRDLLYWVDIGEGGR